MSLSLLITMKLTSRLLDLKNFSNYRAQEATMWGKGTVGYTKFAACCLPYKKEDRTLLGVVQLTGGGPNREL